MYHSVLAAGEFSHFQSYDVITDERYNVQDCNALKRQLSDNCRKRCCV